MTKDNNSLSNFCIAYLTETASTVLESFYSHNAEFHLFEGDHLVIPSSYGIVKFNEFFPFYAEFHVVPVNFLYTEVRLEMNASKTSNYIFHW